MASRLVYFFNARNFFTTNVHDIRIETPDLRSISFILKHWSNLKAANKPDSAEPFGPELTAEGLVAGHKGRGSNRGSQHRCASSKSGLSELGFFGLAFQGVIKI